ncbi:hypothetical protein CCO02nite_16890 [Cellulomonas composti]|uniref:Uncharacterized protein n=1 Tax=Cellulomonas composti TaxID=266130 RepID=A0A511JAK4_9CELL|nr:hypothetical protein CCO02nite_16890 [Cellulomonas composti]
MSRARRDKRGTGGIRRGRAAGRRLSGRVAAGCGDVVAVFLRWCPRSAQAHGARGQVRDGAGVVEPASALLAGGPRRRTGEGVAGRVVGSSGAAREKAAARDAAVQVRCGRERRVAQVRWMADA